jgi:hypothetical protein
MNEDAENGALSGTPPESLLKSARRELVVSATVWLIALVWSVGYCAKYGYHFKTVDELTFVFGIPSWIFYGVFLPWGLCTAFSGAFAFGFMQDAELGEPVEEPPSVLEGDNAAE